MPVKTSMVSHVMPPPEPPMKPRRMGETNTPGKCAAARSSRLMMHCTRMMLLHILQNMLTGLKLYTLMPRPYGAQQMSQCATKCPTMSAFCLKIPGSSFISRFEVNPPKKPPMKVISRPSQKEKRYLPPL